MPDSEKKKEWTAANSKRFTIKIMKNSEADILERLETVENRAGYIKQLIREDIARNK